MSGLTVVYVVFSIVVGSIFAYLYLMSMRHREVDEELAELAARLGEAGEPR